MKNLDLCKLKLRYAALRAKHYSKEQIRETKAYIKEQPFIYLAIALGAGFLIGKLLSHKQTGKSI